MAYGVTGASGHLGKLIIEHLLAHKVQPSDIVALVRDPSKASGLTSRGIRVATFSYNSASSDLAATLRSANVSRLVLVSSNDILEGHRVPQHTRVIDAAKAAGVEFFVYTSAPKATDDPAFLLAHDHAATEKVLRASGVPFAVLRNYWYTENSLPGIAATFVYGSCAGDSKFTPAARTDLAEAAAVVLERGPAAFSGATFELAGDELVGYADIAQAAGRELGKSVEYISLSQEQQVEQVSKWVPPPIAKIMVDSELALQRGTLTDRSGALRALLGHPLTTVDKAVAAFFKK